VTRIATILFSALAAILAFLGLRSLAGKPAPKKKDPNTIPPSRTREDGSPIPMGEPDSRGTTQAPVGQLELPGIFEPKTSVGVGDQKVQLPDGLRPSEVEQAVVVQLKVDQVEVEDRSGITQEQLEELLRRYNVDQPPKEKP
jgi:hypothetical protein